jgi:DNA-directed RNA polymerase omega subunit
MSETEKQVSKAPGSLAGDGESAAAESRFRVVVVASQRSKQLQRGARPRVEASVRRSRNTSIALEEVRRGLVGFVVADKNQNGGGAGQESKS